MIINLIDLFSIMTEIMVSSQEAKFNAAMLSVTRLHNALVQCNEYSYSADVSYSIVEKAQYMEQWKSILEVFYREISCKLKNSEDITKNEIIEIENFISEFDSFPTLITYHNTEFNGRQPKLSKSAYQIWKKKLHKLELRLRHFANYYKLLIPDKEDNSRYAASH